MYRKLSSLALAALLLLAHAATAEGSKRPSLYVVGDSISIQYGPHLEQYLATVCDYARKTEADALAIEPALSPTMNGGDSSRVRSFLEAKAATGGPHADYLLLNCGLHDIKTDPNSSAKQVPLDAYRENLEAIVGLVAEMKMKAIWVRTTPADETVHNKPGKGFHRFAADVLAYNAVADEIMAAHDVPSIDLHTFTSTLGPDLYADHVHFPEHIQQKQAAYIAGALAQIMEDDGAAE